MKKKVTVHSPATVANLVCGFDILGLALNEPYDVMTLEFIEGKKLVIEHTDPFNLPEEPTKNVAGVALLSLLEKLKTKQGLKLTIEKKIKPGSGIGSSAASAAGAVVAANYLLDAGFSNSELVEFAMNGEGLASGSKHADNIAPCIYGGVTLIRSMNPLDIISIPSPNLFITVVHPQIEVKTSEARAILKQQVKLKDAIKQWGNVAGLVSGFFQNDLKLIGRSLEDVIIEPVRSILIPGFYEVKTASMLAGALGGGISGSGPSIFMFSETEKIARSIEEKMASVYTNAGIDFNTYVTTINQEGVKLIPGN